jgi:hypothetical protein
MPRTVAVGILAAALFAASALPAAAKKHRRHEPASLGQKPFTLTADQAARKVNVGVDAAGTGHFVWNVNVNPGDDPLHYCRVPRGARACAAQMQFALPLEAFGEPQVVIPAPGEIVLIAYRCCGDGEGTYAVVSTDGGNTFGAPHLIGSVEPGQATLWPGTSVVALTDDVVTAGIHFEAAAIAGPQATTSANVGDGSSQSYDGTVGFPSATAPIVAFDDLTNTFFRRWSGAGDVNSLGSWGPTQQVSTAQTEARIGTGPGGVVLMTKHRIQSPFSDEYVARRYNPTTNTWGSAVALSNRHYESDVIFRDIFEDSSGHVAAIWIANGGFGKRVDPMRYRVSTNGGKTWKAERTLVKSTSDSGFNLQMGAAPDGGGFAAYDDNDQGPLKAVPIPKLSKQR